MAAAGQLWKVEARKSARWEPEAGTAWLRRGLACTATQVRRHEQGAVPQ